MGRSKECRAVVTSETKKGEFGSFTHCLFVVGGNAHCQLTKAPDNNYTQVAKGFCVRGTPENMPNVMCN